jgi:hypothetical protein
MSELAVWLLAIASVATSVSIMIGMSVEARLRRDLEALRRQVERLERRRSDPEDAPIWRAPRDH